MKGIKPEWQLFINEYIASGDHIGAYLKAYPHVSRKVASNKGKELLKRPDIDKIVQEMINRKRTLINEVRDEEIKKSAKERAIAEIELDRILVQIAQGKHEVEKIFIIRNRPVKLMVKPTHDDITTAIDKLYKRYGSYAPEKRQEVKDPFESKSNQELEEILRRNKQLLDDN